jgi:adenylate kinase
VTNIILFGPPGSGKGTQAAKLRDKYALLHVSTGDIFRAHIKNNTPLGTEVKGYLDAGKLVPDELTIRILEDHVATHLKPQHKGIIFDGFPRTIPQAEALDAMLTKKRMPVRKVLALNVDDDEVTRRIVNRGKSSGRSDDADETTVRNRLQVYKDQTFPLRGFYEDQGKFVSLDGEGTVDEVFEALCEEMDGIAV